MRSAENRDDRVGCEIVMGSVCSGMGSPRWRGAGLELYLFEQPRQSIWDDVVPPFDMLKGEIHLQNLRHPVLHDGFCLAMQHPGQRLVVAKKGELASQQIATETAEAEQDCQQFPAICSVVSLWTTEGFAGETNVSTFAVHCLVQGGSKPGVAGIAGH